MIILYFKNNDKFYKLDYISKITRQTPMAYEIDGKYYLEYHVRPDLITRKEIKEVTEEIKYGILYLPPDVAFYEIKEIMNNV